MESFSNSVERTEQRSIKSFVDRMTSLVSRIYEKYPNFVKMFERPGVTVRILTAFVMLQGGQLLAKDISSEHTSNDPFKLSEMVDTVAQMPLSEIADRLKLQRLTFLDNKQIAFSCIMTGNRKAANDVEDKSNSSNTSFSGDIPIDTGIVGDVGVYISTYLVQRSNSKENSKNTTTIEEYNGSSEVKVSKDFTPGEIQETKDIVKITGKGFSKKEAMINALEQLSMYCELHLSSGTVSINESKNIGKGENIGRNITSFVAENGIHFFKDLHIDKIEAGKEGGEAVYVVSVSAQIGKLQTPEANMGR
jgi:hypothetical protein